MRLRDVDIFLLCDWEISNAPVFERVELLRSDHALRESLKAKLADKWVNAGAAHLTCFTHSVANGYTDFWNIDADDTMFFEGGDALVAGMRAVEEYALRNETECFSLDMYQTFQFHWSFGMTFTRNSRNYVALIDQINTEDVARSYPPVNEGNPFVRQEDGLIYRLIGYNGNIDWFFTFMRDQNLINAKSFYFEKAHFAHVGIFGYDPLGQLVNGVYHWREGRIWDRPVMKDCIGFYLG